MQLLLFSVYFALYLAFFLHHLKVIYCYSFSVENVKVITQNSVKDTYFSYSLLLQADGGKSSSLIVGAPKPKKVNNEVFGGDIYKCDINESTCVQYPVGKTIDRRNPNGNLFGINLDGDGHVNGALVACAPRALSESRIIHPNLYYLKGYCIYLRNSSRIGEPANKIIPFSNADPTARDPKGNYYYNFAFAMAGFSVSYYSEREILLGAPGVKKFNGAVLSYSLDNPRIINVLPYRVHPLAKDEDTYFGYSVTAAQFLPDGKEPWFVAGAPRANNLKGKVTIYFYDVTAREKMNIVTSFEGDEVGSYFGASILAMDVSNDRVVDLLVGAPMAAGKTWDEGIVYFYKGLNAQSFLRRRKLTGSSKEGSRFGTAIVSLGDFDLDGYNDVAISAPHEDDDRGAVYIYRGTTEGLTEHFDQRLSPTDFAIGGITVKGFGLGISKGNDIDGNGHNDIAIGAYKTDQVFILTSYSIIDYQILLNRDINSINNDTTSFNLQFCVIYTKRSERHILGQVDFAVVFEMDYRSAAGNIADELTVNLGQNTCKGYGIRLRQTLLDISPFQINLRLETKTANIIAHGEKSLDVQIPYSHGCGDDNICHTDLTVELSTDTKSIILGLNKEINLNITVNNDGEPAYRCEVKLVLPDGLDLRNAKDCIKNDGNYTCLLKEKLVGSIDKRFVFDIRRITPDVKSIEITAEVASLGTNKPGGNTDRMQLHLPVILESSPYIIGKSIPENMGLELGTPMDYVEVVYQFSVGKNGPSPLQVDTEILIPIVEQDGESIFNILEVTGTTDDIQVACAHSVIEAKSALDGINDLKQLILNRTILVSCESEESCMRFSCKGEYLYNSGQLAVFKITMRIKMELLALKYKSQLSRKNLIALVPVAYQRSSTERIGASAMFLIFVHGVKSVPLWVYLLSSSIGVIVLILLTYALYRCHFFDRIYKDKLEQEKILVSSDSSIENEIFDDIVFHPMEENVQQNDKEKDY